MVSKIEKQAFTRKEAANYLGLAENTLRKLLDSGEVPYTPLGRRLIIPKAGLDNYLSRIITGKRVTE